MGGNRGHPKSADTAPRFLSTLVRAPTGGGAVPFNRDLWSAAMLLHWVLTRDEGAVLKMLDDYGSFEPSLGGELVRTVAETWTSVGGAYATNSDNTLKDGIEARWQFHDEL